MPIRINLLAEAHAEEELRRRDPVKRSIIGGSILVAGFLVYFSSIWANTLWEKSQLSGLDAEIMTRTNEYSQVLINQKKAIEATRRLESLQKLAATRFLQGNLMDAFQKLYIPNVQLTRVKLEQSFAPTPPSPPTTNSYGVIIPGRPGTSVERIMLTLDAKDSSPNAGDQVNHFKDALVNQDYFKSLLDRTTGVRLANTSAPQAGSDGKTYVMFTLECKFADTQR